MNREEIINRAVELLPPNSEEWLVKTIRSSIFFHEAILEEQARFLKDYEPEPSYWILTRVLVRHLQRSAVNLGDSIVGAPPRYPITAGFRYNVILKSYGQKQILTIKLVRDHLKIGLEEAINLVESLPQLLAEDVSALEASSIKSKFEVLGAVVEARYV